MTGYGKKYYFYFRTLIGNVLCECRISQRGYKSTATELQGAYVPYMGNEQTDNDNHYDWIKRTKFDIGLVSYSNFQFLEFFTADAKKYYVEIIRDSQVIRCGFVVPDTYREPYQAPNYDVFISVSDNINTLKEIEFTDDGRRYTDKMSLLKVIGTCLAKTGMRLDITEGAYIYESTMDDGDDDSPIDQASVSMWAFYKDDRTWMNCYDVLTEALKACNCQLYQKNGKWYIVPLNARKETCVLRNWELHTIARGIAFYNFVDSESVDLSIDFDGVNHGFFATPAMQMLPAWKRLVVKQDYLIDFNLLKNVVPYDVGVGGLTISEDGKTAYFKTYWLGINYWGSAYEDNYHEFNIGEVKLLKDDGSKAGAVQRLKFSLPVNGRVQVYMKILCRSAGVTYWLGDQGEWGTSSVFFTNTEMRAANKYEIEINENKSGIYYLQMYMVRFTGSPSTTTADRAVSFNMADIKLEYLNASVEGEKEITTIIDLANNYEPDEIELKLGDVPDFPNRQVLAQGLIYVNDVPSSGLWSVKDKDRYNSLANVIADEIASNHVRPLRLIIGDSYGFFALDSLILLDDKKYIVHMADENLYDSETRVELVEVGDTEQGFLKLRTGGYVKLRTGGKIKVR